jgi:single-strand DNA-binding protein
MAAGDTQITITGNLVDDPELRFTPAGQPVAKFRVASTPRYLDKTTNEWKDGDSLFLTCNVWRQGGGNPPRDPAPRHARHRLRPAAAAVV